jgi:hypothetical protein
MKRFVVLAVLFGLSAVSAVEKARAAGGCDPSNTRTTTICHVPPGNPQNAQTLCVGNSAVKAHLTNHAGDTIGACASCGDGVCNGDEDCSTCPNDCGQCQPRCGDGICNGLETCRSCPGDCGACPPICGDGTCDTSENCNNCSADCGICPGQTLCCQKLDGSCSDVTDCNAQCFNDPIADSCTPAMICTASGCAAS